MYNFAADFLKEREVIAQEIMPVLREFCEHQGVEMELIDMGTKKDDIINMATQFSDLDKCQRESLGPFYVVCHEITVFIFKLISLQHLNYIFTLRAIHLK